MRYMKQSDLYPVTGVEDAIPVEGVQYPSFKTAADGTVSAAGATLSASTIALGGLAVFQIWSGLQQADTIRQNAKLKQRVDDMNAQFADLNAFRALQTGQAEAADYQKKIDAVIGGQREAYASKNIDVNYGTASEMQADARVQGVANILNIQKQARDKALGYSNQAINERLQGQFKNIQGIMDANTAEVTGIQQAAHTAISGYSRITGKGLGFDTMSNDPEKEIG